MSGKPIDEPIMMTIEVSDGNGNIISSETVPAQKVNQRQIDEMVYMIEHGTPAWLASMLVMQDPSLMDPDPNGQQALPSSEIPPEETKSRS